MSFKSHLPYVDKWLFVVRPTRYAYCGESPRGAAMKKLLDVFILLYFNFEYHRVRT